MIVQIKRRSKDIEAIQYLREENIGEVLNFCPRIRYIPGENEYSLSVFGEIVTLSKYDWIVRSEDNKFEIYENNSFLETYQIRRNYIIEEIKENKMTYEEEQLIKKIEKERERAIGFLNALVRESCIYKKQDFELYKLIKDQIIHEIKTTVHPEQITIKCSSPEIKKINVVTMFNTKGVGLLVHLDCVNSNALFQCLKDWIAYIVKEELNYVVEYSCFNYNGDILINLNEK